METIPLRCNSCGASLHVAETARFLTCGFCGTELAVRHSGSAVFTEAIEEIREQTAAVAGNLEIVKLQNELERLDREWLLQRERYAVRHKHGTSYPGEEGGVGAAGNVVALVVVIGFGIFWMVSASSMGAPGFFPIFGLIFIGFAVFQALAVSKKREDHQNAEGLYLADRARLRQRIEQAEKRRSVTKD